MRLPCLAITLVLALTLAANESPHGSLPCNDCHEKATAEQVESLLPVVRCQRCHADGAGQTMHRNHSHPVDVEYRSGAGSSLRNPDTAPSGLGGTVGEDLLSEGRIVCTSCHDPHGKRDAMMLLDPGELCVACHDM